MACSDTYLWHTGLCQLSLRSTCADAGGGSISLSRRCPPAPKLWQLWLRRTHGSLGTLCLLTWRQQRPTRLTPATRRATPVLALRAPMVPAPELGQLQVQARVPGPAMEPLQQ